MVKRMLVDANHPEETRVVVLDGTRLEEFDLETSTKKQNKGNIYLAKVVRVEPSLQAAFVDYGGNRHGFLAFSEIHPDYYQIPVADREALLAEAKAHEDAIQRELDEDAPNNTEKPSGPGASPPENQPTDERDVKGPEAEQPHDANDSPSDGANDADPGNNDHEDQPVSSIDDTQPDPTLALYDPNAGLSWDTADPSAAESESGSPDSRSDTGNDSGPIASTEEKTSSNGSGFEEVGGDDETEENLDVQRRKFVASRRYKIQEVIKRRQILLVQVVKEERGTKGAALTTYLSLAGRYCVLMPNSSRGGGVSRKITNTKDRRRLKSILSDLNIPDHMAVILRTAGAERGKAEVRRDFEYLQRAWNQIREVTMESRAPTLIHEEANLIRRSIRDIYSKDIEEIFVEGEEGYKAAKEFMKTLTPSHAKKVKRYKDETIPLFHRYQVESQLDAMHSPTVQLKSGGSIVFGQTEALVAIDVNSGRATKERHIEETALKTNLEAADEIARQLRLRDLAGLVVIDFIDMDEHRNNHAVERRLKEALKSDRARIQVGRISHFGLLELSRQRLRPSLIEANFETCKTCGGTGMVRSVESTSIQTLRAIEEEGLRHRTRALTVHVHPDVALYILNYKRAGLEDIEKRYEMDVFILGDSSLVPPELKMDRVKGDHTKTHQEQKSSDEEPDAVAAETADGEEKTDGEQEGGRKKKRRRRRKRKDDREQQTHNSVSEPDTQSSDGDATGAGDQDAANENLTESSDTTGDEASTQRRSRRRGRRGGRKRRKEEVMPQDGQTASESPDSEVSEAVQNEAQTDRPAVANESPDRPSEEGTQTDPIPVQPTQGQEPSPPSRFMDVFRRGADAFRSSSKPETTMDKPDDGRPSSDDKNPPKGPKEAPASDPGRAEQMVEPAATPPVENRPSEPPRRGWWNKGSEG